MKEREKKRNRGREIKKKTEIEGKEEEGGGKGILI